VAGPFWERMILLAVVRVASAAAALFGLPVIVAASLLLRCSAWAYNASTFYRNTCSTVSSRRVECVKWRTSIMMPPVIVNDNVLYVRRDKPA
jgi:hypothetical protein